MNGPRYAWALPRMGGGGTVGVWIDYRASLNGLSGQAEAAPISWPPPCRRVAR